MAMFKYGPDGANLVIGGIPIDDFGDTDPAITIEEMEPRTQQKRGLGGAAVRFDNVTAPIRLTVNLMPGSDQARQLNALGRSGADITFTFAQSGTPEKWAGFDGVIENRGQEGRAGKSTVSDTQFVLTFNDSEST